MERETRSAAFASLAAELGSVTALATEQMPSLRAILRRLAALSVGVVELWRIAGGATIEDSGWRLLAVERAPLPGLIPAALTPPLDEAIRSAALCRQTIALETPTPTLALPLIAWDRVQGVLLIRAAAAAADLLAWQAALERFAPLLALCLATTSPRPTGWPSATVGSLAAPIDRECLVDQIERELARARRARHALAILLIGLDQFAALGRAIGDDGRERAVAEVGVTLRTLCRDGDLLRRYSDDTFLLLMPESDGRGATFVAQRYLDHLYRRPIDLPDHAPLYLDLSIGIALFPVDGLTPAELVESAADALVAARRLGGRRAVAA